jgi:serine/threonine-protein kinase
MAEVRVGRDIASGRWVAIKSLRKDLAGDPRFRSSLRREAQTMARLRHHSIVALRDTDTDDDEVDEATAGIRGVRFIVMEYVAGSSSTSASRTVATSYDHHSQSGVPRHAGVLLARAGPR